MNALVIHYKELALKGRNRPWFVQQLVRNVQRAASGLGVRSIRSVMGRIEVELPSHASVSALASSAVWTELRARVGRVFGIANFSYAGRASREFPALAAAILEDLGDTETPSFRVDAR